MSITLKNGHLIFAQFKKELAHRDSINPKTLESQSQSLFYSPHKNTFRSAIFRFRDGKNKI